MAAQLHKHTGMRLCGCAHDACQLLDLPQVPDYYKANVQQQRVCLQLLSCCRMSTLHPQMPWVHCTLQRKLTASCLPSC